MQRLTELRRLEQERLEEEVERLERLAGRALRGNDLRGARKILERKFALEGRLRSLRGQPAAPPSPGGGP